MYFIIISEKTLPKIIKMLSLQNEK